MKIYTTKIVEVTHLALVQVGDKIVDPKYEKGVSGPTGFVVSRVGESFIYCVNDTEPGTWYMNRQTGRIEGYRRTD
jgi:hypothetical protein